MLAVGAGAAVGAWLRWWLSVLLNPLFPAVPLGTLASNLIAGFLIGVMMELLELYLYIPPYVRLLVITGCLGSQPTTSNGWWSRMISLSPSYCFTRMRKSPFSSWVRSAVGCRMSRSL